MEDNLQNYIVSARQKGTPDEQIRQNLISAGWQVEVVDQAMPSVGAPMASVIKKTATKKILIIVGAVVLILVVGGFVAAKFAFQKINTLVPGLGISKDGLSINSPDGTLKVSNKIPDSWPNDIPIYPDSKVTNSFIMNQDPAKGGSEIVLNLNTDDDLQAVRDYYKKELVSNGWKIDQDNEMSVLFTLVASKNSRGFSLMLARRQSSSNDIGSIITITSSDQLLSDGSSQSTSTGQSQNDCGFSIFPPKGWSSVDGITFRNDAIGSEIRLGCKQNGFEDNYYVLMIPAQSYMTKPDSGIYVMSTDNTTVAGKKAYIFREEHNAGGIKNYELVLMIDSGIKNASKNQMDIIYARMPGEYKTQYEAILKEALYSYKR